MNKITTTFCNIGGVILKVSSRIRSASNEPCYNQYNVRGGYITLTYNPSNSFTIETKDKKDLITIRIEEFYTIARYIKDVYKSLAHPDMFHMDDKNKLIPNKPLVKEAAKTITAYDKVMIIKPDVVTYNDNEYEGIAFIINNTDIIRLRHFDAHKLYKLMNKTDISNYVLQLSSIALTLEDKKIQTKNLQTNEFAVFHTPTPDNNNKVLYNNNRKELF